MNQDFSELIQYLDKKFQETAKRKDLEELTTKLVSYEEFGGFRKEVNQRFDTISQQINGLSSAVDAYAQKADTYFQKMVMLSHKVDRHEKWIQQIAKKLGIKLEY